MRKISIPNIGDAIADFPDLYAATVWYKFFELVRSRLNTQDTGWTISTGVSSKGAYAVYTGHVCSAGYVQAEAQATDNAIKVLSARVKALEDAARFVGGID